MNKYYIMAGLCFASVAGFSQSQTRINEIAKDPKTTENAAKADVISVDKKAIVANNENSTVNASANSNTTTDKRKKSHRDKAHKQCSRMKS